MRRLVFGLVALAAFGETSFAQESTKKPPKPPDEERVTVYFAVVTGDGTVEGATRPIDVGGPFWTKAEAAERCKKWQEDNPESNRLALPAERTIAARDNRSNGAKNPNRPDQPPALTGPKGSKIGMPDLKVVDPGSIKGRTVAASLAGKKGTGTFGRSKVTIEFVGKGEKGEFIVSGDMTGKGKWTQLGPFVQLEGLESSFVGKIDGDMIGGRRTVKKSGVKEEWSVKLAKKPPVPVDSIQFTGSWSKGSATYVFDEDGTGKIRYDDGKSSDFNWKYMGRATFNRVPTEDGGQNGSWEGPKLRWWFGDDPNNKEYATELGLFRLGAMVLLVPDSFYDGRSWYTKQ